MSENNRGYSQALSYCKAVSQLFYSIMDAHRPADRELKSYFREHRQCGSRDRRFISEALYGLFRWYGWLKEVLPQEIPENPLESQPFCQAMQISLWMEGEVDSNAYNVLVEKSGLALSADIVSLDDKRAALEKHFNKIFLIKDLVPKWFRSTVTEEQILALQKRPPVWIRVKGQQMADVLKELDSRNVSYEKSSKVFGAVKLMGRVNINEMKTYREGCFEIQDLASQCLALACNVAAGENWWDVCAGGGGKSLALREEIGVSGSVTSTDKRQWILKEVDKRAQRAGYKNIRTAFLESVYKQKNGFHGVLVDAPCSCTGTWRRNPDLRWLADEKTCEDSALVQKEILGDASVKVKPGGMLIYATCSMSPIENEQVVEDFLKGNDDFELEPFRHPITGDPNKGMMYIQSLPEDCDTMFAARMIRIKK
jgi:16S rRNA (cytosine967-C5)-methyltransferase